MRPLSQRAGLTLKIQIYHYCHYHHRIAVLSSTHVQDMDFELFPTSVTVNVMEYDYSQYWCDAMDTEGDFGL